MARRSDHSREELTQLTLSAARGIVEREGLRALTARAVAREIGYSVGTIYNLYDNIDDLIVHLAANVLDDLHAAMVPLPGGDVEDTLIGLARRYLAFTRANQRLWNVLFEHSRDADGELPEWYFDRIGALMGLIEELLCPLYGPDHAIERARSARVLWAGVHGIAMLAATGRLANITAEGVDAMVEDLVHHYVKGVREASGGAVRVENFST